MFLVKGDFNWDWGHLVGVLPPPERETFQHCCCGCPKGRQENLSDHPHTSCESGHTGETRLLGKGEKGCHCIYST